MLPRAKSSTTSALVKCIIKKPGVIGENFATCLKK